MAWPTLLLASPVTAVVEAMARQISSRAMTMPVRVPGSPILERLSVRMMFSFQTGAASLKMAPGKGSP